MGEKTTAIDELLGSLTEDNAELKVEEIAVAPRSKMRVACE